MPRQSRRSGPSRSARKPSGRLEGSVYIGEPLPGNQYRLFEIASGFGINASSSESIKPDPVTGQVDRLFRRPAAGPVRRLSAAPLLLRPWPDGDPDRSCTVYTTKAVFYPWNSTLAEQESTQIFSLDIGSPRQPCARARCAPSTRTLVAGTSNPEAGAFSAFTLKLDREDGDQFLGKLNFTMPPGLTGEPAGHLLLPGGRRSPPRRRRSAAPSRPARAARSARRSGPRTSPPAPALTPSTRSGRSIWRGRSRARRSRSWRSRRRSPAPTTTARSWSGSRSTSTRSTPMWSPTPKPCPSIIGGIPIRMRSIQVNIDRPNFMINPTNCAPFSVDSQGIGDQGTVANFSSDFQAVNCATLPLQAEDDDQPARRPQGDQPRRPNPAWNST